MALKGLSHYCGQLNLPGLTRIEYVPTAWVDRSSYEVLISSSWMWRGTLQLSIGDWLSAPVISLSPRWNEPQQRSQQGTFYNQAVSAISADLLPQVQGEFDEMANYRYLLRLTDRYAQRWILGTLDTPFQFFADGTSGGNGALKSHNLRWTAQTLNRGWGLAT